MSRRPLWTIGDDWADFKTLLAGEASGPVSFVTINRTIYVVDAANARFCRTTHEAWNTWASDDISRSLLDIVAATPCGLRMRWGRGVGEFVSTTPVIAVYAGNLSELSADELPLVDWDEWEPRDHPRDDCGAMNCVRRRGSFCDRRPDA